MASKFQDVAATVAALEAAAKRVHRFKQNLSISSHASSVPTQMHAVLNLFKRMKISTLVTAKVGAWQRRLILLDVIVNYADARTRCRTGEEAYEMATLMNRAMTAVRTIIETNMPGVANGLCSTFGIYDGGWRFQ